MKWNKSGITQKFLTESHYNENYLDHARAYKYVNHWRDPHLPTFQPAPLHKNHKIQKSSYQQEYFDKSPGKSAPPAPPQSDSDLPQFVSEFAASEKGARRATEGPARPKKHVSKVEQIAHAPRNRVQTAMHNKHKHRKVAKGKPGKKGSELKPKDT